MDYSYIDTVATMADGHIEFCNTPDSSNRNKFICHHCTQSYTFKYPIGVDEFTALIKFFTKHHKKCQKK